MSIEVIGISEVQQSLKELQAEHDKNIKESIAITMVNTRYTAGESPVMIPNRTGTYNPRKARKKQPSVPGKITVRTGKLRYMLQHKTKGRMNLLDRNALRGWVGSGRLYKEETVALKGLIRTLPLKTETEHIGTYKVNVDSGNGTLFSRFGGAPQETLRTLRMRFLWETGIRGNKRPFFAPAFRQTMDEAGKAMNLRTALYWRL
jgi:hypothetical protein